MQAFIAINEFNFAPKISIIGIVVVQRVEQRSYDRCTSGPMPTVISVRQTTVSEATTSQLRFIGRPTDVSFVWRSSSLMLFR